MATAAHPRAPQTLSVLSIYGMLDLTSRRYTVPGVPLVGPPMEDTQPYTRTIENAKAGTPVDGYLFPADPTKDM